MTCANNCKGVDPNSVIIGGTALLAAASVGRKKYCTVQTKVSDFPFSPCHHTISFKGRVPKKRRGKYRGNEKTILIFGKVFFQ